MSFFCIKNHMDQSSQCECLWKQIDKKYHSWMENFNFETFWNEVISINDEDCYILEMSVYTSNRSQFQLYIGHDLRRNFNVSIIFRDGISNQFIALNWEQTTIFFSMVRELIAVNTIYPEKVINSSISNNENNSVVIRMSKRVEQLFELKIDSKIIKIDEQCLLDLISLETRLLPMLQFMSQDIMKINKYFFKILYLHMSMYKMKYEKEKYDELIRETLMLSCSCMSNNFLWEFATNQTRFLQACAKIYTKISVYDENNRLKTFETHWPLKCIKPKSLAQLGFFYIGEFDKVQCAFCGISLWMWGKSDNIYKEHYRFAPHCPLLSGKVTMNIPLDMIALKKILPIDCYGYDTVH